MPPTVQLATQILDSKARRATLSITRIVHSIKELLKSFQERKPSSYRREEDDFFIIRAVTFLEVFVRLSITELVNMGSPYLDYSLPLAKNIRVDLEIAKELQGKQLTLGDLIAYSVSVNNVSQLVTNLGVCLGKDLIDYLSNPLVRDPSPYEAPPAVDLDDAGLILQHLDRLFQVRHILVHEVPNRSVYALEDVEPWLTAATSFIEAAASRIGYLLHGTLPTTTWEIAHQAAQETRSLSAELDQVLAKLQGDDERKRLLTRSQSAWKSFVDAQCAYRADSTRGGTMSTVLFAYEEREQYTARLNAMRWYLERSEQDL